MSRRRYDDDEPSRRAPARDADDDYTVYESGPSGRDTRDPRGSRAGAGAGAGDRAEPSSLKHIDESEAKRLMSIIKTDGDSDYKAFILYVKDGDANSCEALDLLNGNVMLKQQTFIQEVSLLRVRPTWLNGVPIIVDKADSVAHRGRVCLEFLRNFRQREAMGMLGRRLNKGRRTQFETGMAFSNNMTTTSSPWLIKGTPAEHLTGRVPMPTGRDAGGKVTERDVQAFMEKRGMSDDSAKRWQRKR